MSLGTLAVIIGAGLCLSAFFSGAEIAILSADPAALKKSARSDEHMDVLVEKFLRRPQWYLGASLLGATLGLVMTGAPAAVYGLSRFGPAGVLLAFAVVAPLHVFFGAVLPKVFFHSLSSRKAVRAISRLRIFIFLFYPALVVLLGVAWFAQKALGRGREGSAFWYTRDELKLMLTSHASQPDLDLERRHMIERVFEFSETLVEEVMIPLVEVEAFEDTASVREALRKFAEHMYSRYPVYRERIDNVIGMLETVDLLEAEDPSSPISAWVSAVRYVPFSKPIDELLFAMQKENFDFAVVVDEYGGCVGIITREDILEEIVGEIEDEHDDPVILYKRLEGGLMTVNARMEIDDINEILGWGLPFGEYETLGGFLLWLFRRVPRAGERIRFRGLMMTISKASPRAVQEVMVEIDGEESRT